MENGWFVPTTYSPTKVKLRMVCCQENEDYENVTLIDETNEYEASTSYRTWMRHAKDRSWSARPWKVNSQFVESPTVTHCEGHNTFIRSMIEVHEYLIESLFDKLSNEPGLTFISCPKGLQKYHNKMSLFSIGGCIAVYQALGP